MKSGTIVSFTSSWGSGIARLVVKNKRGIRDSLMCDSGPTVRALDAMFPGFITPGHTCDPDVIIGKTVYYDSDDDLGMLTALYPESED